MRKAIALVEDCCPPLLGPPLDEEGAEDLAGALRVLADPARLRLLSLISAKPGAEACACDLVEPLGLSQPTVSHHLKVLHESGLLWRERRGRWVHYGLRREPLDLLARALAATA